MIQKKKPEKLRVVLDEMITISSKKGNGILSLRASVDGKGRLKRYSLTYINPHIFN